MNSFSLNLSDFVFVWWGLLYEAIPFVAIGALLAGIVERCVSRETVARCFPKSRWLGVMVSAGLGLVFPMCECGVVPIVRRLFSKGVPVACGIAYLLASPIVNPLVIVSTLIAFRTGAGWEVVALRVGAGYLIAIVVGLTVWKFFGEQHVLLNSNSDEHASHASEHSGNIVVDVLTIAAGDFLQIGATLAIGAAIAAVINSGFSRSAMEPFASSPWTAVPGMMALAVALNLCSEADAFVASSFYAFPLSAKLAFLVLGPMFDLKLLAMYTTIFRPRAILLISGLVLLLVFLLGITNFFGLIQP